MEFATWRIGEVLIFEIKNLEKNSFTLLQKILK